MTCHHQHYKLEITHSINEMKLIDLYAMLNDALQLSNIGLGFCTSLV